MTEILLIAGVAIGAVVFLACAVVALEWLARTPALVAGAILIHAGLTTMVSLSAILAFGSITVYLPDVIYGLTFGAGLVRIISLKHLPSSRAAIAALAALALFSVARGAVEDFARSINEFRLMFYFLSGALYFVTVEPTREFLERVTRIFYAAALLTLTGTIILWAASFSGASLPDLWTDPYEHGFRVVHGTHALLLAQACLIALPAWRLRARGNRVFERYLVLLLIPAVFVLQWKVVWILFLGGLALVGARDLALGRKLLIPLVVVAMVSLFILPAVFGVSDVSLVESLSERTNPGTFLWRVEGWDALLESNGPQSISEFFFGAPYGRGWERIVDEQERTTQPHNFYLDNFLRHGLLGVALLVLVYIWAIRRLMTGRDYGSVSGMASPGMWGVLLVTQLVFFVTFSAGAEQGVIAGIGLTVALSRRNVSQSKAGLSFPTDSGRTLPKRSPQPA